MDKKYLVIFAGLIFLASGCSRLPNGSNNMSLLGVTLNMAVYKSSVSQADAGETVIQRTRVNAGGNEALDVPLLGLLSNEAKSGTNTVQVTGPGNLLTAIPIRLGVGVGKSASQSASAGVTVIQDTELDAVGSTQADVGTLSTTRSNWDPKNLHNRVLLGGSSDRISFHESESITVDEAAVISH